VTSISTPSPNKKKQKQSVALKRGPASFEKIMLGVPYSHITRVRFMDYYVMDCGVATYLVSTFRGNSIFDPQAAVGGGSPTYAAQWAAFYTKYKVLSSRIHLDANNEDAAHTIVGVIARAPDVAAVGSAAEAQQLTYETDHGKQLWLPNTATEWKQTTLDMERTTDQMVGPALRGESGLTALCGANPAIEWDWDVVVFNQDTASAGATVHVTVVIDYTVQYFAPTNVLTD